MQVLLPIVSALSILGTDAESLNVLGAQEVLTRLVWFLSGNHPGLLSAASVTMANLTCDPETLERLEALDAARLFWSLLKHPSPQVQAGAATAIAAFSQRSKVFPPNRSQFFEYLIYHISYIYTYIYIFIIFYIFIYDILYIYL